jgi:hypothetical protein
MDIQAANHVITKAILGIEEGEVAALIDEARRKKGKLAPERETMLAIKQVLKKSAARYAKHFGGNVEFIDSYQNAKTEKRRGNIYGYIWLSDKERGYRYYFLVVMWQKTGSIKDVYPEIRRSSDDTTLARGQRQMPKYSHETIPFEDFGNPKKMFGSAKPE